MARRTKMEAAATRDALLDAARARVPRARRRPYVARRSRGGGRRHARRRLLALPRQGGALRGAVRARAAADGGDARLRRRDPAAGSARRAARARGQRPRRGSRPMRARRRCSTSSSTSANSPRSSPRSPGRRHATDSGCLANVERLLKQAVAAGQLAARHGHAARGALHQCLHGRRDARMGAGPGGLRPRAAAPAMIDTLLAGLAARPPLRRAPRSRRAPRARQAGTARAREARARRLSRRG